MDRFDPRSFEDVIVDLAAVLTELGTRAALIVGFAVSLRAEPRFTQDIDALLWQGNLHLEHILQVLRAHGFAPNAKDPVAFASKFLVFPATHPTGCPIDLTLARIPYERQVIDRAEMVQIGAAMIPVATGEDLAVMKALAGRPKDLADLASLGQMNPKMDKAYIRFELTSLADALETPEVLDHLGLLDDGPG